MGAGTDIKNGVCAAIGNTPLIRLSRASQMTGCEILGKAEFLNPGQSVKDRAALYIVRDALERELIRPGGLIVEGTAGNTGIGLAMIARALGFRCKIVIPRTQSQEKKDAIRQAGAELVEVDAKPFKDPGNYQRVAARLAEEARPHEPNGAIWAEQFDNLANRRAHYETTGPEIWRQTGGRLDAFICAIGTGGTISGVGMALKERNPKIVIGLVDPGGSAMYSYFKDGELTSEGSSISEGIGQGRVTKNVDGAPVDHPLQVSDHEMMAALYDMAEHDGLIMGGSAGVNVAGAIKLAKAMGPGHVIVTVLCDYGSRYASKLLNPDFLREQGLPVAPWLEAGAA